MWFTAALGTALLVVGCIGGDLRGRSAGDDLGAEIADEAVAQEAARMELASGGWLGLGRAIAAVDGPAGDAAVALDPERVRRKLGFDVAYAQRVRASFALQTPAPSQSIVIGIDNRIVVNTPRQYPYNKHVYIVMQRPHTELDHRRDGAYICSGTFLDEDFVLTAAHCIYNRDEGHFAYANEPRDEQPPSFVTQWGTDYGRGFACLGGDIDSSSEFATNCEFVLARWAPSSWTGNTAPEVESDFALIKLERANHPDGLGAGAWMALSSIDDAANYATKQAVINGFPVDGPDGSNFVAQFVSITDPTIANPAWQTANWEFYSPAHLYHRSGAVDSSTTQQQLAYLADSSGGDSGSGVFYYTDGSSEYTGQSHYIIGVHHGSNGSFNVGASVHQFRDWVTTMMSSN
jgi:V8-like Glu-specific endopeptidase